MAEEKQGLQWEKQDPEVRKYTQKAQGEEHLYEITAQMANVIWVDGVKVKDPEKSFRAAWEFKKVADAKAVCQQIEDGEMVWPQPDYVKPEKPKPEPKVKTEPKAPKSAPGSAPEVEVKEKRKPGRPTKAAPAPEKVVETEKEADGPQYEELTAYLCTECGELSEDAGPALYECSSCGEVFNKDNSKNGRNQCPSCDKMGARKKDYTGLSCVSCEAGEVQEVAARKVLDDDTLVAVDDWDDYLAQRSE